MKGSCLCGAVEVSAPDQTAMAACHCGMCRRWGGGPLLGVHCGHIEISGTEQVSAFKSSDWAERGFCSRCGTHLFYRLVQANEYVIPVGLFGDTMPFEFKEQIFTDHKPGYYEFANRTARLTEAEVFAKYM